MYKVLWPDWLVNTTINSYNGMSTYKAATCGLAFLCSRMCIKTCAVFSSLSRGHLTKRKRPLLICEYEMLTSTSITFFEMPTHVFYFFFPSYFHHVKLWGQALQESSPTWIRLMGPLLVWSLIPKGFTLHWIVWTV